MAYGSYADAFPPYVSAAERRRMAAKELARLRKMGLAPEPIALEPRGAIARTFWGQAWCEHLESYADLASRLPRGRSYLRSGSVVDLKMAKGEVRAVVVGSEVYRARVEVAPLAAARWKAVRKECAGRIGTLVELLAGKLSSAVMEVLCDRARGIFPGAPEIDLSCSCPDGARLCKHLAAVLYGVGARLDRAPELLFTLRGVDGAELVASAGDAGALVGRGPAAEGALQGAELAEVFGIELDTTPGRSGAAPAKPPAPRERRARPASRRRAPRRAGGKRRSPRRRA